MNTISIFKSKPIYLVILALFAQIFPCQYVKSQGLIQTMTEQLAKLELYLQEAKQGYNIVQQGLTTIGNIKKGDFDLHNLFFSSLFQVDPAIKQSVQVAGIVSMELEILSGSKTALQAIKTNAVFTSTDIKYLSSVYNNLTALTLEDIDELTNVITDGTWQMTPDERITRIDILYRSVTEKYTFLRSFTDQILKEGQQRSKEKNSLNNLSKLFQP